MAEGEKVILSMKNGPNTPQIEPKRVQISKSTVVGEIVKVLRSRLQLPAHEALFVYVQHFCPSPLDTIGTLCECYGNNNKLTIHYCKTEVWG